MSDPDQTLLIETSLGNGRNVPDPVLIWMFASGAQKLPSNGEDGRLEVESSNFL